MCCSRRASARSRISGNSVSRRRRSKLPGHWSASPPEPRSSYPTMVKPPGLKPVMAFANTVASINVWSLPIIANTGTVTGEPAPVTQELLTWVSYPSLSADATKMSHIFVRSKEKYRLCLRDLKTGSVANVSPTPPTFGYARVSPDGSRVAYRYEAEGREAIYVLPGEVRQSEIQASPLCGDCGRPMDWSPDNRNLLFGTARKAGCGCRVTNP